MTVAYEKQRGLQLVNVSVAYGDPRERRLALDDVSLSIEHGEVLGLVGESGSGKSTLAYTILDCLPPNGRRLGGTIKLAGFDLFGRQTQPNRYIGVVYQDPSAALNPTMTVGDQLAEAIKARRPRAPRRQVFEEMTVGLRRVNLDKQIGDRYPHEISGGEKQRIVIAMALAGDPAMLIWDEPTTALDATTAVEILDLVREVRRDRPIPVLYITHDLAGVGQFADRLAVMYRGRVVETGSARDILQTPRHPYTQTLIASVPDPFRGDRLSAGKDAEIDPGDGGHDLGCGFRRRCRLALPQCDHKPDSVSVRPRHTVACWRADRAPAMSETIAKLRRRPPQRAPLFRVRRLEVHQPRATFFGGPKAGSATVEGVSLDVRAGATLGLVGESGCGKSTIAKALAGLIPATGDMLFGDCGLDVARPRPAWFRQQVQLIFQHPDQALNPRMTIGQSIARPLKLYGCPGSAPLANAIEETLHSVRLSPDYAARYPHQLSGGEKQRVAIARAFAARPRLVICDEITSGLDVSVQASIMELLRHLQDEYGTSFIFISHDLNLVRLVADDVAVMYAGQIVERRTMQDGAETRPPLHPYSEALLAAAPVLNPSFAPRRVRLGGIQSDPRSATGCRLAGRCPRQLGSKCELISPPVQSYGEGSEIRCHIPTQDLAEFPNIWAPQPESTLVGPSGEARHVAF